MGTASDDDDLQAKMNIMECGSHFEGKLGPIEACGGILAWVAKS